MEPEIVEAISALKQANWFSQVGKELSERNPSVVLVRSWQEVRTHVVSQDWEDATLEAGNDLHEVLVEQRPRRWSGTQINAMTSEMTNVLRLLVVERVGLLVRQYDLPPAFEDGILWNLTGYCHELLCRNPPAPGFFTRVAKLHLAGHVACGWIGAYPDGQLVVY